MPLTCDVILTFLDDRTLVVKEYAPIRNTRAYEYALTLPNFFRPILQQVSNVLYGNVKQISLPSIVRHRTHVAQGLLTVTAQHGTRADGFALGVVIDRLGSTLLAASYLGVSPDRQRRYT